MIGARDFKNLSLNLCFPLSPFSRSFILAVLTLFIFAAAPAKAQTSGAPAWKTQHRSWDEETSPGSGETWRDHCSSWVQNDLTANIFTAPDSPMHGTNVYCSTAALAIHARCAYINNLPLRLNGADGQIYTNESVRCPAGSSSEGCFRKFLSEVLPHVNTSTLSKDTHPVSISRKYVKPGQILLYYSGAKTADDGRNVIDHTHTITDISSAGVPFFLSASSLGKPQVLSELRGIQDPPFTNGLDGIRDWTNYTYDFQTGKYSPEKLEDQPGSKEYINAKNRENPESQREVYVDQYTQLSHQNWGDAVSDQLGHFVQSDSSKLNNLYASLCDAVHMRETYVNDADKAFANSHQCPNADQWERFSTVAKDERIWNLFKKIDELVESWRPDRNVVGGHVVTGYDDAVNARNTLYRACSIESVDRHLNLLWLRQVYRKRLASSDPYDANRSGDGENGINKRWGLGQNPEIDLSKAPPAGRLDWPAKYEANYIVSYNACPLAQGSKVATPGFEDSKFEEALSTVSVSEGSGRPAPVKTFVTPAPVPYVPVQQVQVYRPPVVAPPAQPVPVTTELRAERLQ